MSIKRTVFAGIIFFVCLGLYIADNAIVNKKKVSKEISESLTHIPADKIKSVIIINKNGRFELNKNEKDRWEIVSHGKLNADYDTINTILNNLNGAKKHNILETKNFSEYGLDKPKMEVTIFGDGMDNIKSETIQIGEDASYAGKVFAKIKNENKIFTVTEHIKNHLDKDLDSLRDKSILHLNKDNIETIYLKNQNDTILLRQTKSDDQIKESGAIWYVEKPAEAVADSLSVENLINNLRVKKILGYINNKNTQLSEYGLDIPLIVLTVKSISNEKDIITSPSVTLIIGSKIAENNRYYAMRDGENSIFQISEDLVKTLSISSKDLRNRKLFSIPDNDIQKVVIVAGKSRAALIKNSQGTWKFEDDDNTKVDQNEVMGYINKLREIKIKTFENDEPASLEQYGLARPLIQVELTDKGGKSESLLTGLKDEEKKITYVKRKSEKSVYGIDWTLLHKLLVTKEDFIDKSIVIFDENYVDRLEILFKQQNFTFKKSGTYYLISSEEGDKLKTEASKIIEILSILNNIKYSYEIKSQIISNSDHGLDNPTCCIKLINKADEKITEIKIGNSDGDNFYLGADGRIFKVPKNSINVLFNKINSLFPKSE